MPPNSTARRAFVAWVHDRHVAPVDLEVIEAAVQHLEAQMDEITRMAAGAIKPEETKDGDRAQYEAS